jgi:Transglutaminase-like superfamily
VAKPKADGGGLSVLALPLKILWAGLVICTPLIGVWVASSLATYLNGPVWAAVVAGVALFPGLPLLWDWLGEFRRGRRDKKRKADRSKKGLDYAPGARFLTFFDRLILRTLIINVAFIAGLLASYPEKGFEALATRGDWMLEGRKDATSEAIRERMFWAAEKLAWLYQAARDNPFEQFIDEDASEHDPEPTPDPTPGPSPSPAPTPTPAPTGTGGDPPPPPPPPSVASSPRWPMKAGLHPVVANMPADVQTSYKAVAQHIATEERDPTLRVKALHDYVANRVAYDAVALADGRYPPQDATTVFNTKLGVCAGYAKLLTAMGKEVGLDIAYVVGDARTRGWEQSGESHAWNAVKVEGQWYLVDPTWNAGYVNGREFTRNYRTDYLFTPPHVFGVTHFPNQKKWQLRKTPVTRGAFLRQPILEPQFYAAGLELIQPKRSQTTVPGSIDVIVDNPKGLFFSASYRAVGGGAKGRCDVKNGARANVHCNFGGDGRYELTLFGNEEQYGSFRQMGQLAVNSDR